jgi:hypothetical protein
MFAKTPSRANTDSNGLRVMKAGWICSILGVVFMLLRFYILGRTGARFYSLSCLCLMTHESDWVSLCCKFVKLGREWTLTSSVAMLDWLQGHTSSVWLVLVGTLMLCACLGARHPHLYIFQAS